MTAARPLDLDDDLDVRPLDLAAFPPDERAEIEGAIADYEAGRLEFVPGERVTQAIAKRSAAG
jgi:hypothetical protein